LAAQVPDAWSNNSSLVGIRNHFAAEIDLGYEISNEVSAGRHEPWIGYRFNGAPEVE